MVDNPILGTSRQRRFVGIGCLAVFVLFAVVIVILVAFEPDVSTPAATDLPKAIVRDAGLNPPDLDLELDFGSARSGDVITAAGTEMAKLGKQMISGPQPVTDSVSYIDFQILGGAGKDPSVGRKLLHVRLKTDTMKELARRHASGVDYLNAAYEAGSWTPANDDMVNEFCVSRQPICDKLK